MNTRFDDKFFTRATLATALLGFALRTIGLGAQSMWWDEIFSVTVSRMPFPDWLNYVFFEDRSDLPGLFYQLSVWTQLGLSEFIVRFPSAFWGTLSIPMISSLGRRFGSRWVGLISAFLLALSPYHVWYSQEGRVYATVVFFVLLSVFLFLKLLAAPKRWIVIAIAATNTIGLYLYYLFPLVLMAQMVFLILTRKRHQASAARWLLANAVAALLFIPWFGAVILTGGFARAAINWIPAAQWFDPAVSVFTLSVGTTSNPWNLLNWITPLIFVALAVYGVRAARLGSEGDTVKFHVLWFLLPFTFVFVISLPLIIPQKRSLYSDRYLILELPALLLLVSYGAARMLERRPVIAVIALVLAALPVMWSLAEMNSNPSYARDDWRAASSYVATHADPDHDEIALEASLTWPYSYYDRARLERIPFYEDSGLFSRAIEIGLEPKSTRLWLLTATIPGSAHRFVPDQSVQLATAKTDFGKSALDRRYPIESERLFQGILVTAYRIQP